VKAPETIAVDGQPYSLEHGKVFLFFDPECCMFRRRQAMSHLKLGATRRWWAMPTQHPQ